MDFVLFNITNEFNVNEEALSSRSWCIVRGNWPSIGDATWPTDVVDDVENYADLFL